MRLPELPAPRCATVERPVTNLGDIAVMLKLPAGQTFYRPQTVTIHQITEAGGERFWRPRADADTLLLGDSFANIFSLEPMGWGEAAGLAEHLSLALGRPLDTIVRNDAGSWATRDILARELKRGNDRLAGKKLVIWEFAARELASGDWKLLPLKLGERHPSSFLELKPGAPLLLVTGTVGAATPAPRPRQVPYKDHIIALHLQQLDGDPAATGREAVVLVWSMRDNVLTRAARWRVGDRVALRLRSWADVSPKLAGIKRDEFDDESLIEATPCWGEEPDAVNPK